MSKKTYKGSNGKTYAFKKEKCKFRVGGSSVDHTAETAIKDEKVMERLINRGSNLIEEVVVAKKAAETAPKKETDPAPDADDKTKGNKGK